MSNKLKDQNLPLVEELYKEYQTLLLSFAYNRTRSHEDAEDLLQEAYCRLLSSSTLIQVKNMRSLAFTVLKNLVIDKSRRGFTKLIKLSDSIDCPEELPGDCFSPERILIGSESLEKFLEILHDLPKPTREAFFLARVGDVSHRQIASLMGVTVSMVEKHIALALQHLQRHKFTLN